MGANVTSVDDASSDLDETVDVVLISLYFHLLKLNLNLEKHQ